MQDEPSSTSGGCPAPWCGLRPTASVLWISLLLTACGGEVALTTPEPGSATPTSPPASTLPPPQEPTPDLQTPLAETPSMSPDPGDLTSPTANPLFSPSPELSPAPEEPSTDIQEIPTDSATPQLCTSGSACGSEPTPRSSPPDLPTAGVTDVPYTPTLEISPAETPPPEGSLEPPSSTPTSSAPTPLEPTAGALLTPTAAPASSPLASAEPTSAQPTEPPTPPPTYGCPEGMAGVYEEPEHVLTYCIDRWEVLARGELGSKDQYAGTAIPTQATTGSYQSVIPSIVISYDQAYAACANTPIYHQNDGILAGYKHLSTVQEWADAGDGLLGAGGSCYPYEGSYDPYACATLDANNQQVYSSLQPTGSFPKCQSRWGVMDQLGNAWEWADSGMTITIAGWFSYAWAYGAQIRVDEAGYLYFSAPGQETMVKYEVAGADSLVERDSAGYLAQSDSRFNSTVPNKGYLKVQEYVAPPSDYNFLPIQLVRGVGPDPGKTVRVKLLYDDNGAPIPQKLGNAYYAGDPMACASTHGQQIHFHDFDGTISFRCVSDPVRMGSP